ncbi:hypothetical protein DL93DRAFT_1564683 [Clavulina sp. PMI_390]|nr:hypothetical protein DL93DRAFT_1564683 [Clavulina sp. PMI_390]
MMIVSGDFPGFEWLKKLWILSEAATDLLVALIVVYSLKVKRKAAHFRKDVLQRLIVYTISNGLLTSTLAITSFALFQFLPQDGLYPGINLVLARVYANSVVASLNLRGTWMQNNSASHPAYELTSRTDPRQEVPSTSRMINDADDGLFSSPIEPHIISHSRIDGVVERCNCS